jgi:parvulin-like peptidyl-prolyl isomerase
VRAATICAIVCACLPSCGGERRSDAPAPAAVTAALGGTVVARVGDVAIDRALVLSVARAQHVTAEVALQRLIDDALLAEAARRSQPQTGVAESSVLARALVLRLKDEALAKGPFTDEEIAGPLSSYWLELDRPEKRTIVHALIKREVAGAEALARTLQKELSLANGPDAAASEAAFTAHAKQFKVTPQVHVEKFAIVADGRVAALNGGSVLEPFTKGTFAIPEVLGTSDVVETTYGFHVIRLLGREPPLQATREQKIERMKPDLIGARVRTVQEELLNRLRSQTTIAILATDNDLLLPR